MYLFFSNMKVLCDANMEGRKKITFFLVVSGGFIYVFISFEVVLLFFGWRKKKRGSFQWCCVFLIFCCSHALIKSEKLKEIDPPFLFPTRARAYIEI